MYQPNDEKEGEIKVNEEFAFPGDDIAKIETWAHLQPQILKYGRVSYYIPSKLNQDLKDELKGNLEGKDPQVERLKGIEEDKDNPGNSKMIIDYYLNMPLKLLEYYCYLLLWCLLSWNCLLMCYFPEIRLHLFQRTPFT
jgi:hypothetical protein